MEIPAATGGRRIWLRVGTLVDGGGGAPARDAHLVYDRWQILFVGGEEPPRELVRAEQRTPDADLPHCTAVPGLIEAHAHLFLDGAELDVEKRGAYLQQSPARMLEAARERLEGLARLGIAGVRDAGDKDGVGLALSRERKAAGDADAAGRPYVDSPGAAIYRRGRYGGFMGEAMEECASPQACVEARVGAGADRIKLIATGVIDFRKGAVTGAPQMTVEEIREVVAAAQALGRQTFAHASGAEGIERAIEGGVDSVEHGYFVREDQLAKMRDRGIAWAPTLAPVEKQVEHAERLGWDAATVGNLKRILEEHGASVAKAQAMGVTVLAGSDAGSYGVAHGMGLLEEMALMERAGMSAAAVLRAATGAAAERLGLGEKIGMIRVGYRPRFVVTEHDPLRSVRELARERLVVWGDGGQQATRNRP